MKQQAETPPPCVLSIAGSDPGGGAGIQADLKTFAALGVHGLSAVTALTAQNMHGISAVHVPPVAFLQAQLEAAFGGFAVAAVKIGMLACTEVIHAVADALERHQARNIVLDPVMVASSGARLLDAGALEAMRQRLFPLARLITPNLPEAQALLGRQIENENAQLVAARQLKALGAHAVLLKGGHLMHGSDVVDVLLDEGSEHRFRRPRLAREGRGTGCTLAAAISVGLARGMTLEAACRAAGDYVFGALQHAFRLAPGQTHLLAHGWSSR